LSARLPRFQGLEEVVALVVNEDECGEVLDLNLPNCLHAKLRILYAFDALDRTLREYSSNTTDGAEIETTMLLTSLGDNI